MTVNDRFLSGESSNLASLRKPDLSHPCLHCKHCSPYTGGCKFPGSPWRSSRAVLGDLITSATFCLLSNHGTNGSPTRKWIWFLPRSLEEAAHLGTAPSSALSQRSLCLSPRCVMCVLGIAGIASLILPAFEGSGSSAYFTRMSSG